MHATQLWGRARTSLMSSERWHPPTHVGYGLRCVLKGCVFYANCVFGAQNVLRIRHPVVSAFAYCVLLIAYQPPCCECVCILRIAYCVSGALLYILRIVYCVLAHTMGGTRGGILHQRSTAWIAEAHMTSK